MCRLCASPRTFGPRMSQYSNYQNCQKYTYKKQHKDDIEIHRTSPFFASQTLNVQQSKTVIELNSTTKTFILSMPEIIGDNTATPRTT